MQAVIWLVINIRKVFNVISKDSFGILLYNSSIKFEIYVHVFPRKTDTVWRRGGENSIHFLLS